MKILEYLKILANYFLFIVIGFLLIVIYLKNNKINNLTVEVNKKPKIEYVETTTIDTIISNIPTPYEVIKWRKGDNIHDSIYLPSTLGWDDTIAIAEAYSKVYTEYASIKKYDEVLKDDTIAYIQLKEDVQYNSIFNRQLIYENRKPAVYITKTTHTPQVKSFVMGMSSDGQDLFIGAGLITRKNAFYSMSYSPINKTILGTVYLPVFNFK